MLEIYTDGCYNTKSNIYGYGVVVLYKGKKLHMKAFEGCPSKVQYRNVAGEIDAATYAMQYALDNLHTSLILYTDYEGVIKWCTGEWQTKNALTKEYKRFYDYVSTKVNIQFVKVKSHVGDPNNELADKLAKKGAGKL